MNEKFPNYLYHYTSVENLALILETKKMRFNSLANVDDMQEVETYNLQQAGKYCFVSCFTEDENESIPIWNMYAKNGAGLRLKLKSNAFEDENYHIAPKRCLRASVVVEKNNNKFRFSSISNDFELVKIKYTSDQALLYPKFEIENNDHISFDITRTLGRFKNTYWEFQKEWRYIKFITPSNSESIIKSEDVYTNFIDISLKKEVLDNMEITLGYNISLGNELIVKKLTEIYNKINHAKIQIVKSGLFNMIRTR